MMKDDIRTARLRRAPSGKIYVVSNGEPVCAAGGGLRYFDDEDDALDFLARCDLAEILGASAT